MPELGMIDRDERDVVDLVHDVLAGVPGDRGLEFAGQVRQRLVADEACEVISSICGVGSISSSAAMPATGEPRTTRGTSPHASVVPSPTALEAAPDLGHGLDLDPVQLDVLAVGEVGGVAAELGRDAGDHPQLLGRQLAAVDADPQHEVLVLELVRLEGRGPAAVDPGLALRVETPHAEPPVQVGRVDRGEPALASRCSRCARARARPLSTCFHSSLPLSGVVPSIFHCPLGLDEGRGGRARAASPGAVRSARGAPALRASVSLIVMGDLRSSQATPGAGPRRAHSREATRPMDAAASRCVTRRNGA